MKKFNRQIFTSFNLLLTFIIMLVSGIVLYFKPEGSVARWLDWKILGVNKSGWESLHTVFSFLFLLFALYHILEVHVKQIRAYLFNNKPGGFRTELYLSLLVSIIFLIGTILYMPPFHTIYKAGDYFSAQWAELVQVEHETVGPRQPLTEVAGELGMDSADLKQWMNDQEIERLSGGATLSQYAENQDVSPYWLYKRMKSAATPGGAHVNSRVYRSITLEEISVILEVNHSAIVDFLTEEYGLDQFSLGDSLYDISREVDQPPQQVKSAILEHFQ